MSDMAAWGTFIGVVCTAVGGLVGGIIVALFKYGGEYKVKVMRAQAALNEEELKRRETEIIAKDHAITVLTTRVEQLEGNIKDIRDNNHKERNAWYVEQLKQVKEAMERESRCHREAAELRGQLKILTQLVSDRLPGPLAVKVLNTANEPIPVHDSKVIDPKDLYPPVKDTEKKP